ncbi:MAG: sigma-70 family RNA polymerase sigma factor [Bifidobacteriaceae bacterium]|jgi:RNA polymerase sigma-70 factor (ECF subfamily)|nr:sigma-70 family RNA polymerase sigma factor [Bifidobacteriaceae bacterium]
MATSAAAPAVKPTQADQQPRDPLFTDTVRVIERFESLVYGLAVTHTPSRVDADDVYQNVFLTYHRKQPACHDEEHIKAWLIRTTLNCARQVTASPWRSRLVPLEGDPAAATPDRFEFRTEQQQDILAALNKLSDIYRTVLHLFYFEDMPVRQIADLLDIDPATVKMRLSRGRGMMRQQLQGDHFNE